MPSQPLKIRTEFLGRIPFSVALAEQKDAEQEVFSGHSLGVILGFESEPVVTLGLRGREVEDLIKTRPGLERLGFAVHHVDRGGQATIHAPGQLVVFPVCRMRNVGVRHWIATLAQTTQLCLAEWGVATWWNDQQPGLYTSRGKIMACGVRVRRGISTHGVAINVHNDLANFRLIRSCGSLEASNDCMTSARSSPPNPNPVHHLLEPLHLSAIFSVWTEKFNSRFAPELTRRTDS